MKPHRSTTTDSGYAVTTSAGMTIGGGVDVMDANAGEATAAGLDSARYC